MPLVLASLVVGLVMARWLAAKTRQLARTDWTEVSELKGASLSEFRLANGGSISLGDQSTAHVIYLFQNDCAVCDAQRVHVAGLLESAGAGQVVTATSQPALLSPGYWGDFGSSLAQPAGADSAWLAERQLDRLPMLLFVDRSGRVTKAIRGSLMTWSERAFRDALAAAGA